MTPVQAWQTGGVEGHYPSVSSGPFAAPLECRNSLAGFDFDELKVGMPVAFTESDEGVKGIQASTVRVPTGIGPKPRHR